MQRAVASPHRTRVVMIFSLTNFIAKSALKYFLLVPLKQQKQVNLILKSEKRIKKKSSVKKESPN